MILDIRVPDLTGPELALRVHRRHSDVPILFTSGWTNRLADPDSLGALRWEFLPKPFDSDDLVAAVQRLAAGKLLPVPKAPAAEHQDRTGH